MVSETLPGFDRLRRAGFTVLLMAVALAWPQPSPAETEKTPSRGINDRFLRPDLDVDAWVKTFEAESREVYAARRAIVAHCDVVPGQRIADIGAGTGLFTRLFAESTGDEGWVYAVEISTRFLEHINEESVQTPNITSVLGQEDSVRLPPGSIDLAFLSDTYHHLEHPESTLRSIRSALRPGGRLVVVDFERVPGESRDWILEHVRAGKEVVRREIEAAGFAFVEQVGIDGLEENYFLKFRKK